MDTDRLDTHARDTGAGGNGGGTPQREFGYLFDDAAGAQHSSYPDAESTDATYGDAEYGARYDADYAEAQDPEYTEAPDALPALPHEPGPDRFDAFNAGTWQFRPAPVPWYRSRQAAPVLVAGSVAVVALVVSLVILAVSGGSHAPSQQSTTTDPSTPQATTATTTPPSSTSGSAVLPPPPPPPPPPPAAEPTYYPPRNQPRPTKKPEINVTRAPMSVTPQPRGTR